MRKLLLVLLLCVAALGFGQATGSVTTETTVDIDAETLKEALSATVAISALSISAGITITEIGAAPEEDYIDLTGDIAYTFGELVKVKLASSYGVDSVDKIPITLTVEWPIWKLAFTATYKNDDINAEEVETGTAILKAKLSF